MRRATQSSLDMADQLGMGSLALTLMGSGVFGWNEEEAARVIVEALVEWLGSPGKSAVRQAWTVFSSISFAAPCALLSTSLYMAPALPFSAPAHSLLRAW